MTATTAKRTDFTLSPLLKGLILAGGGAMTLAAFAAVARVLLGIAPATNSIKEVAIVIHVVTVVPSIPLGLWLMLARKGDARHRALGKLWMAMMLAAALSAIFIRHINHGGFSFIHLFVPLTIVAIVRAVMAARAGDIRTHKRQLVGLYLGGLLIPGMFSFMPGRMMGMWLFG